ncbi:hypothetical protein OXYTRIMIC_676 [Oxytricha trifallax]|uniref:Uncharacterized protein n=1 Tax=Oxytricha trifallax TaxID=1172189 RepID=A0A073I0C6_9SPIT|nr:hypothetical protein OXYTRIMIC_676 [Oxytricha trifallax]
MSLLDQMQWESFLNEHDVLKQEDENSYNNSSNFNNQRNDSKMSSSSSGSSQGDERSFRENQNPVQIKSEQNATNLNDIFSNFQNKAFENSLKIPKVHSIASQVIKIQQPQVNSQSIGTRSLNLIKSQIDYQNQKVLPVILKGENLSVPNLSVNLNSKRTQARSKKTIDNQNKLEKGNKKRRNVNASQVQTLNTNMNQSQCTQILKSNQNQSSQLMSQSQKLTNLSKNIENLGEQLNQKIRQITSQVNRVNDTIVRTLESKLKKQQFKHEQYGNIKMENDENNEQEIDNYCQTQTPLYQQMESYLFKYQSILKPFTDEKIPKFQFSQRLQISTQEFPIQGFNFGYDQLLQQINDEIIVLKRANEEVTDIVQIEIDQLTSQIQAKIVSQVPHTPNYVILDQDRIIVDNYIFGLNDQSSVGQLQDEFVGGAQISPGLIILSLPIYAKIEIRRWNGNYYEVVEKGNIHKTNTYSKSIYIQYYKFLPSKDYRGLNIFSTEFFTLNNMQHFEKVLLNQKSMKDSQRTRLGSQKVLEFRFIDSEHLLTRSTEDIYLVNYESGQNLQQFKIIQSDLIAIPSQFNMQNMPVLIKVSNENQEAVLLDVQDQGFQGSMKLQSLNNIYGNLNICSQQGQYNNYFLASDQHQNLYLQQYLID